VPKKPAPKRKFADDGQDADKEKEEITEEEVFSSKKRFSAPAEKMARK
jgi:hypothetical protein